MSRLLMVYESRMLRTLYVQVRIPGAGRGSDHEGERQPRVYVSSGLYRSDEVLPKEVEEGGVGRSSLDGKHNHTGRQDWHEA